MLIVRVPPFGPIVPPAAVDGGANTTPIVQLLPELTVNGAVGHVPAVVVERRKYAALAPPIAMEVPVMFRLPAGLASVTSVDALTTPRAVGAKTTVPVDVVAGFTA